MDKTNNMTCFKLFREFLEYGEENDLFGRSTKREIGSYPELFIEAWLQRTVEPKRTVFSLEFMEEYEENLEQWLEWMEAR